MTISTIDTTVSYFLNTSGQAEATGKKIASSTSELEDKLLSLYSKPQTKDTEADIQATQIKYQRSMRVMTLFSELMKNSHEMMMNIIRGLRLG